MFLKNLIVSLILLASCTKSDDKHGRNTQTGLNDYQYPDPLLYDSLIRLNSDEVKKLKAGYFKYRDSLSLEKFSFYLYDCEHYLDNFTYKDSNQYVILRFVKKIDGTDDYLSGLRILRIK